MTVTAPPGKVRFRPSAAPGRYLVYAEWSALPAGTVVKRAGGKRWEGFTRLGRSVGQRTTRRQAGAMLAAWNWQRLPAASRRSARKALRP